MLPLVRARVGPEEGFLVVVGGGTEGILALQGLDGVEVCNECTYARIREYHTMHMCVYVHSYTQKASWPCKAWRVLRHSCMNVHTRARTHTHTHTNSLTLSLSLSHVQVLGHMSDVETLLAKSKVCVSPTTSGRPRFQTKHLQALARGVMNASVHVRALVSTCVHLVCLCVCV